MYRKLNIIGFSFLCLIFMLLVGVVVANAQEAQPEVIRKTYMPLVNAAPTPKYTISGRVLTPQNTPIAGVKVQTDKGQSTTTNSNGDYTLSGLTAGWYTITPSLSGMTFSPPSKTISVPPNATSLNFTGSTTCYEAVLNGGFENNSAWIIPLTAYPAGYSTAQAHTGSQSLRTGIVYSAHNTYSYSSAHQRVSIPAGHSASFTFWVKPASSTLGTLSVPEAPQEGTVFSEIQLAGDVQYVLVLDANQNILRTLLWQLSNSQAWTKYTFDLSAYSGQTIYLHFGTYNDGLDGFASMYVDDVSLYLCPVTCQQLIVNGDFSGTTGWTIPLTDYPAGYSNAQYRSAFRSMRTGIVFLADNTFSYSDFRQKVSIPSSSSQANLSMWVYRLSSGTDGLGETEAAEPEAIAPTGMPFTDTILSEDVQYLLVLDQDMNWIDTLIWQRTNNATWTNLQFSLKAYAGRTIYLQWGSFNNGSGGVTAMYVDDVSLQVCP